MNCSYCGSTDRFALADGRVRCSSCFATYDAPKVEKKTEKPAEKKTPKYEKTSQRW